MASNAQIGQIWKRNITSAGSPLSALNRMPEFSQRARDKLAPTAPRSPFEDSRSRIGDGIRGELERTPSSRVGSLIRDRRLERPAAVQEEAVVVPPRGTQAGTSPQTIQGASQVIRMQGLGVAEAQRYVDSLVQRGSMTAQDGADLVESIFAQPGAGVTDATGTAGKPAARVDGTVSNIQPADPADPLLSSTAAQAIIGQNMSVADADEFLQQLILQGQMNREVAANIKSAIFGDVGLQRDADGNLITPFGAVGTEGDVVDPATRAPVTRQPIDVGNLPDTTVITTDGDQDDLTIPTFNINEEALQAILGQNSAFLDANNAQTQSLFREIRRSMAERGGGYGSPTEYQARLQDLQRDQVYALADNYRQNAIANYGAIADTAIASMNANMGLFGSLLNGMPASEAHVLYGTMLPAVLKGMGVDDQTIANLQPQLDRIAASSVIDAETVDLLNPDGTLVEGVTEDDILKEVSRVYRDIYGEDANADEMAADWLAVNVREGTVASADISKNDSFEFLSDDQKTRARAASQEDQDALGPLFTDWRRTHVWEGRNYKSLETYISVRDPDLWARVFSNEGTTGESGGLAGTHQG